MNPNILIESADEPITLGEAYANLRIDYDSDSPVDEALITLMIKAARDYAEKFTGLNLIQKTLELSITEEVSEIYLPGAPILEIDSVTYETYESELDSDGEQINDSDGNPSIITTTNHTSFTVNKSISLIKFTGVKPTETNNFKVTYLTGYGTDSDALQTPSGIKIAILLMLGHLYEHREDATEKTLTSIPNGVVSFLRPYRERLGMA